MNDFLLVICGIVAVGIVYFAGFISGAVSVCKSIEEEKEGDAD